MKLDEYLKTTTQTEFAKRLGVSQGLINQWLTGKTKITAERAVAIEHETGGKIRRHELRPDLYGNPAEEIRHDEI